jgi:hypothetical protein
MYVKDGKKYFDSLYFNMSDRKYKLIGAEIKGRKVIHTVRNPEGELKEFEHDELINLIEQYP